MNMEASSFDRQNTATAGAGSAAASAIEIP